jgi:integrase
MARTIRNAKLDTRSARIKITPRREPYWVVISKGCALGYRRGGNGGTWIARLRDDTGKQHYESLGASDDARDPDGLTVFDYAQAQEMVRAFALRKARELAGHDQAQAGPYKVARALDDYFADRERHGSKGVAIARMAAALRIKPTLGDVELAKLTTRRLRDWHTGLANAPKLARAGKRTKVRKTVAIDPKDAEGVRARRSTANRILTILKAALNYAFQEGHVANDEPWRKVKPFREVDAAVIRFLKEDECRRIVNACDGEFRDLVRGALLTGCRYGELTRMEAGDYNPDAGTVSIRVSKAGKPRHVALTPDGATLFDQLTAGKASAGLIFVRHDGKAWGASHQQRPLEEACKRAGIEPAATFHILRHTYASQLAMRGAPMRVIAAQLGHADTRMTEKHYAHLAPNYVAETVRASLPSLGIVEKSSVMPIRTGAKT